MTTAILAAVVAVPALLLAMIFGAIADDCRTTRNDRGFTRALLAGVALGIIVFGLGCLAGVS